MLQLHFIKKQILYHQERIQFNSSNSLLFSSLGGDQQLSRFCAETVNRVFYTQLVLLNV